MLLGGMDLNPGGLQQAEVQAWVDEGLLEWPGHVPVQPWLVQTSVYVLPSYREGVPRSTQEAMATGRAVITTDAPGCCETVVDGVNGFLVPVRDVKALMVAMLRFIENPDFIESMGQQSRRMAEERFDVRRIYVSRFVCYVFHLRGFWLGYGRGNVLWTSSSWFCRLSRD